MKVWIDMKLTLGAMHEPTEDILKFAKQLGVKYKLFTLRKKNPAESSPTTSMA